MEMVERVLVFELYRWATLNRSDSQRLAGIIRMSYKHLGAPLRFDPSHPATATAIEFSGDSSHARS